MDEAPGRPWRAPAGDAEQALARAVERAEQAEELLREADELRRALLEAMSEGVVMQDASGRIVGWNAQAERILGLSGDQLAGRTSVDPRWRSLRPDGSPFPGDRHPAMEALRTGIPQRGVQMGVGREPEPVWITIAAEPLWRAGERDPYGVVTVFTEASPTHAAGDEVAALRAEVARDPVSGAASVAALHGAVDAALVDAAAGAATVGLLLVDVSDLDAINERAGWDGGDAALVAIATALASGAPPGATVARTGGGEFAVLVPAPCDGTALEAAASSFRDAARAVEARGAPIELAVGGALAGRGVERGELRRRASGALVASRATGGATVIHGDDPRTTAFRLG